jgi:RHS repeat-associated protein
LIYAYDADGRVTSRSIDGSAESYGYSNAQLTNVTNPLGSFGYTYSPSTGQLTQVAYPNGQQTNLDYFNPSDPLGSLGSLKDISNINGATNLSKFSYTYTPSGDIKTWQQQLGTTNNSYAMAYDADSQLKAVTQTAGTTGFDGLTANQAVSYTYDTAGNRSLEQDASFSHSFNVNNLNQLTDITANALTVTGSTNRAAAITINGQAVTEDANNNYQSTLAKAGGSSTPLTVVAQSSDGSVTVSNHHVLNAQPYVYDANGNLIKDPHYNYVWDAQNRLIQINVVNPQQANQVDNVLMGYDGYGRRVSITERHGTTVLNAKTFVWFGAELCQERDITGHTVNKQFFTLGEEIGTSKYYYTLDHLGSVREMTDTAGTVHARYDYDSWGRQTKLSGDLDADFGYAGYYNYKTTNQYLTWYRVYDPNMGRWLSRDPLKEKAGLNLYDYVENDPFEWMDSFGLCNDGGGGGAKLPSKGNPGSGVGIAISLDETVGFVNRSFPLLNTPSFNDLLDGNFGTGGIPIESWQPALVGIDVNFHIGFPNGFQLPVGNFSPYFGAGWLSKYLSFGADKNGINISLGGGLGLPFGAGYTPCP